MKKLRHLVILHRGNGEAKIGSQVLKVPCVHYGFSVHGDTLMNQIWIQILVPP